MISIQHRGSFRNTEKFFNNAKRINYMAIFEKYGELGVKALSEATPVDSGATASSWGYTITGRKGGVRLTWTNSNVVNGVPIAILLQYGHVTGNGGYVEGRDYINPVTQPIFDRIAEDIWREVSKL